MKRILLAVIVILLIVTAVIGCSRNTATNGVAYNLYFTNQEKNNLVVEQRNICEDDIEDIAEEVMEQLLRGPANGSNCAVIPSDTRLLDLDINAGVALVNFSKAYFPKGANADTIELLARYSVVNTLCDISGIEKVKIFIDGVELTNSSGAPVGALGKEDILLNGKTAENAREESLALYFPDKNAVKLVRQEKVVPLIDNSVEKTIVHELIKGPASDEYISTIPSDTKIISVETKDSICFVNLSSEFITKHADGSVAEAFTVYAIVNSLTELENVKSVQFLIEGKKVDVLKHMLLDTPYTRNEEYISQ
ncbi:MAG: GerMN domain-containing protein [Clostridia bacterium]|nr:GerMN domain-containing protein [Clostridia bacterium]